MQVKSSVCLKVACKEDRLYEERNIRSCCQKTQVNGITDNETLGLSSYDVFSCLTTANHVGINHKSWLKISQVFIELI
jgi:hypothetical protein